MNVTFGCAASEVICLPVFGVHVNHEAVFLRDGVDGHQQCGIGGSETYLAVSLEYVRVRREHLPQPGPAHGRNTLDLTWWVHERREQPGVLFRGQTRDLQDSVGLTREY